MIARESTRPYAGKTTIGRYLHIVRSPAEEQLLLFIVLPILDGFFASVLTASPLPGLLDAMVLGMVTFSGAGALVAVFNLTGTFRERLFAIIRLHGIAFLGVLLTLMMVGSVRHLLFPDFHLVTAAILVSVALMIAGYELWPKTAPPAAVNGYGSSLRVAIDNWSWSTRALAIPQLLVCFGIGLSVLYIISNGLPKDVFTIPDTELVSVALAMFTAGFALNLLGMLAASVGHRFLNPSSAHYGGAFALLLMSAGILWSGLVPFGVPLLVFAGFVVIGALRRSFGRK